jgi:UDP-2,3-diacylglucosamine hydrolase
MIIITSDLHLNPKHTTCTEQFIKLLQTWRHTASSIYILGDLFDYWLGDDDDNEFTITVKQALQQATKFIPIYIMHGNHDFAIGKQFTKETGVQLINDCYILNTPLGKILLSHGDIFCTLDKSYQKMKTILQHRWSIGCLKLLPISIRSSIKDYLQAATKLTYTKHKNKNKYLVVTDALLRFATHYQVNCIIHGHTHNPGYYIIQNNPMIERYEIPNWSPRAHGGYIYVNNETIRIIPNTYNN